MDREYLGRHLSSLSEKRKPNQMLDKIMEILSLQTFRLYAVHIWVDTSLFQHLGLQQT